jgi:hypothetical protein
VSKRVPAAQTPTIGDVPLAPGSHICAFHRGRAERDQLILPFLREGLLAGQGCLYALPGSEREGLRSALAGGAPRGDLDRHLLRLVEPDEFYLDDGTFRPAAPLDRLYDWSRTSVDQPSVRAARYVANMTWARSLVGRAFVAELSRFEIDVTAWARSRGQISVCLYDLEVFGGDIIIPIVKCHPKVWMGGVVVQHPYHLDASAEEPGSAAC